MVGNKHNLKMSQSMALASLTATYTDSEGEEGPDDNEENQGMVTLQTPSGSPTKSTPNSIQSSASPLAPRRVFAKLVSYHDDTVVSDEEGDPEDNSHVRNIILVDKQHTPSTQEIDTAEDDGIQLPPEPPGHCSADLQEKILKLHEKMQNNALDMNALIQQRKDFRNPSIYEKLIQFCGINELGTNYPPEIYDPIRWGKESFYEELAKVQKTEMEKREKERKAKMEAVSSSKKSDDEKKRKSKWDQPGGISTQTLKVAGLIQASLTSAATGTKGTVISAFGSLPKKPRP